MYRKSPEFVLVMRREIIVDCGRRYRRMLAEGEFTRRKTSHALGPSRNSMLENASLFSLLCCRLLALSVLTFQN